MMFLKTLSLLFFIAFTLNTSLSLADDAPIEFGEIPIEDLKMTHYPSDSSAAAAVLCDYGTSRIILTYDGFVVDYHRITRIKILKKEGYTYANFEIPVYYKNADIYDIEASSFTLENGKIMEHELDGSDTYEERLNDYWNLTKFEVPNVKVGSVIDAEYTIRIKYLDIRDWEFQWEIPVRHSRYEVAIPEYFRFKELVKGSYDIQRKVNSYHTSPSSGSYSVKTIDFEVKDIPAFQKESHMTCMQNYLSGVEFELRSYRPPRGFSKDLRGSWKSVSTDLLKHYNFGEQLYRGNVLEADIETIKATYNGDFERIKALYRHIQKSMAWNKINWFLSKSVEDAWEKKIGSSADINLLLVAAMRTMGYQADPVLLSTRSNGFIHPLLFMVDQFNYAIASVTFNNKTVLLDATDKFTPAGILPARCLNYHGRLIDENGGKWVELSPKFDSNKTYYTKLTLDPDGKIFGDMKETSKGYAAIEKRKDLSNHKSTEEYLNDYSNKFTDAELSLDSLNQNTPYDPLTIYYHFKSSAIAQQTGNLLLFNPFVDGRLTDNPFKLEKRDYPVEYAYPEAINYIAQIQLPKGYTVEELPSEKWIELPEKGASLMFSVKNLGQALSVVFKFNINKTLFTPEEYEQLKQLYNDVIKIHDSQILLKKTT